MARVAFVTAAQDEAGNRIGGSAIEARIFDDFGCTVATTVTDDTAGGTTIAQPIVPNAGAFTSLSVTTAAGDTTLTVAATTGFAVGQLISIFDGTNTKWRFIRSILAGPPRLTIESTIGVVFSSTNTSVGSVAHVGIIGGWVPDTSYHYLQLKDVASGMVMPATLIPTMIGNASIAILEEGVAAGTRPTVNFKGTAITAVDNAPSTRVDVTVGGDFSDQAFLRIGTNPAAGGIIRIPNAGIVTSRNAANSGDLALIWADASDVTRLGGATVQAAAGTAFFFGTALVNSGLIRLPTAPTIYNRNAGNTGDEQLWPLATATANLGADVTMTTLNTVYDGPSVTLSSGTWMVTCGISLTPPAGTATTFTAKLWDGTTVYASGVFNNPNGVTLTGSVSLQGILTTTGTPTLKVSAAATQNGAAISAAAPSNSAGNNATWIRAVRIGN